MTGGIDLGVAQEGPFWLLLATHNLFDKCRPKLIDDLRVLIIVMWDEPSEI